MKVLTILGARPQFVKASALSRALRRSHKEIIVHTGQHYDHQMSGVFFEGLELPQADINLGVGSGPHGAQTAGMLAGIEKVLVEERPDWAIVLGDTNSTLAGALAAAKLRIPVAHVEAGLRSFNRAMPEEINRVTADHLSDVLFCPSNTSVRNLAAEGITNRVHLVGDIMLDVLRWAEERAAEREQLLLDKLAISPGGYLVLTVHRSENTDDPRHFGAIVEALNGLQELIVFPVHPRTRKLLATGEFSLNGNIRLIEPLGYMEMIQLTKNARMVLTDSGGLQKEAYWLGVPCVTLRRESEWVETVESGWNQLVGTDGEKIRTAVRTFKPAGVRPALYGDGNVAQKCVDLLGN